MSSTTIEVRGGQPLPRVPARIHRMINSVVCGVSLKRGHRESNHVLSHTSGPSLDFVPTRTDASQFLRGDCNGKFGRFGGKFVPETLMSCLRDLEDEFQFVLSDHEFQVGFLNNRLSLLQKRKGKKNQNQCQIQIFSYKKVYRFFKHT